MAKSSSYRPWLIIAAAVSLIAYSGLVLTDLRFGSLRAAQTPATVGWFLMAFIAFLFFIYLNEKQPLPSRWIWIGAIAFRAILLFTTPTLSDDVYRYLWDGHVAVNDVSPYAFAIEDSTLDYLDVPQRQLANNTWMASPYLPAAQLIFWSTAAFFPLRPLVLQLSMVAFDLAAGWLIIRLLTLAQLPTRRVVLYLWNPLVIVEVAHGAHIDAWMILLTLAAVAITLRPARFWPSSGAANLRWQSFLAPLLLALATLTKILPVLLLPVLFWRWTWPQRVAYGILSIIILLPFGITAGWGLTGELDGTGLFGALRIYGDQWNFNSGIFFWLERYFQTSGVPNETAVAKGVVAALLLSWLINVWLTSRSLDEPRATIRRLSFPLIGYVLLTPTFHPWYLLFLLSFVPFLPPADGEPMRRWWSAVPWIYLSGTLVFSYLTYENPLNFGERPWVRLLEWGPTIMLLFVSIFLSSENRLSNWFHLRFDWL